MFPFPVKPFFFYRQGVSESWIKRFLTRYKAKMETGDDLRMNELTMNARAAKFSLFFFSFFAVLSPQLTSGQVLLSPKFVFYQAPSTWLMALQRSPFTAFVSLPKAEMHIAHFVNCCKKVLCL